MSRSLQIILGLLVAFAAYVFFLLLSFPLDAVIGHSLAQLETQSRGAYRVSFSKMEPSLIFSSVFENFRVETMTADKQYREMFFAKELSVRFSLFALISQSVDVSFNADLKKGDVSGRLIAGSDTTEAEIHLNAVAFDSLPALRDMYRSGSFGFILKGATSGDIYVRLPNQVERMDFDFRLKIKGLELKDITATGLTLPFTSLQLSPTDGSAVLEGSLSAGNLNITNLSFPGDDIELQVRGRLSLGRAFAPTRANLRGRMAFSDKVWEGVQELEMFSEEKTSDGFLPFVVSGNFSPIPQIRVGQINLTDYLKQQGLIK